MKEMRNTRAGTPATVPSRQSMKPNLSFARSMSVSSARSFLAFGPLIAIAAQWSVTELKYTSSSGHSV